MVQFLVIKLSTNIKYTTLLKEKLIIFFRSFYTTKEKINLKNRAYLNILSPKRNAYVIGVPVNVAYAICIHFSLDVIHFLNISIYSLILRKF